MRDFFGGGGGGGLDIDSYELDRLALFLSLKYNSSCLARSYQYHDEHPIKKFAEKGRSYIEFGRGCTEWGRVREREGERRDGREGGRKRN